MKALTWAPPTTMLLAILGAACTREGSIASTARSSTSASDSAFAGVQERGHVAMGVDQYTSTHRFEPLADGGRISLVRQADDPRGVAQIRAHMERIAAAFRKGDFSLPGFVHDRSVPGTSVMAALQSKITYSTDTLPDGGALRIHSTDSLAIEAIHQFLAFQRRDHRTNHAGAGH